jgi:hypothetical protein
MSGRGTKPVKVAKEHIETFIAGMKELPAQPINTFHEYDFITEDDSLCLKMWEVRGVPHVVISSDTLFGKGKGMQKKFSVPLDQWESFQENFNRSLMNMISLLRMILD